MFAAAPVAIVPSSQAPRDQKLHDLVGAGVNAGHPRVTIHSRDWEFVHVAIATEELQAAIDDLSLQLGEPIFGHGSGNRIERAAKVTLNAVVVKHPCDSCLRFAFGETKLG